VTVGGNRGTDTEVVAGIGVGDTVVINGPPTLQDGDSVQIKK